MADHVEDVALGVLGAGEADGLGNVLEGEREVGLREALDATLEHRRHHLLGKPQVPILRAHTPEQHKRLHNGRGRPGSPSAQENARF